MLTCSQTLGGNVLEVGFRRKGEGSAHSSLLSDFWKTRAEHM